MENGVRCQKCNKKVGLWVGEILPNDNHYCLSKGNPDNAIVVCENCYNAEKNKYLQEYSNISKVEKGTTWIPIKKEGIIINYSYYKCLDCGNQEHPNDLSGDAWCSKCDNSKGVEIFLGNDLTDEEMHGWHFTVRKCSNCSKDRGELHKWPNNSLTAGKSKEEIIKMANKFSKGNNCECNNRERNENSPPKPSDRPSDTPSPSSSNPSTGNPSKSKNPLVIGIIIIGVLAIIGIIIWLFMKNKKEK